MTWQILTGDCVEQMRQMDEASVDAIVTDPPYHLTFMGRDWDHVEIAKARIEWWEQHQGREADEVLAETRRSENLREEHESAGQMGLLE